MILDTSALLAILLNEPEAAEFASMIEQASRVRMSAASYLEAAMIIDRQRDEIRSAMLDDFLTDFDIQIEPITVEQIRVARQAFRSFGKEIGPAGLNYGDCLTYALAKVSREPLLFKGNDFNKTDLLPAISPQ
ncbi:MAG: type II toxin-antitoxin system VapC family toxin [Bryobacteraceae bacterium]